MKNVKRSKFLVKQTYIYVQFEDRTVTYPVGKIENFSGFLSIF